MTQSKSQVRLLPIGKFANLCRTTIRTLRIYDKKGLLNPVRTDRFTNYRYYSQNQAREFFKIKLLQNFKASLKEIRNAQKSKIDTAFLNSKIWILKKELEEKKKEYKFAFSMKKFLFETTDATKLLKKEVFGPYVLFCNYVAKGRYDRINSYIFELLKTAKRLKIPITSRQMVFYLDHVTYKPKDTKLEIALIAKLKKIPVNIELPSDHYFKKYPKREVRVFNYRGPFAYITLIYQKFHEKVKGEMLKPHELGFDMHLYGPWNKKSEYDHWTKISFPMV